MNEVTNRASRNPPPVLKLTRLARGMPGISAPYGQSMAEAAAVCLGQQGHRSGVELVVSDDYQRRFEIRWPPINRQIVRTWADPNVATEHGAYGIAALLIEALTGLTVVERARVGTGFDYWLGSETGDALLFQAAARLEVSGIRHGSSKEIRTRVSQKIEQTRVSDGTLPAFIVVVEFGLPQSEVVRR